MKGFSSLPVELVICIVQSAETNSELRAWCTVSKAISTIAQPLLYHEIDFEDCDAAQGAMSLFLLTRTITNSPKIAGWIQCLRIDTVTTGGCESILLEPYDRVPQWITKGKYLPYDGEDKNFSIAVDKLETICDISSVLTASNPKPNVLATLLVSCMTNLTKLTIHVNRDSLAFLSALSQQPVSGYSCLAKIESLCLFCSAEAFTRDKIAFDDVVPMLLLLPKLSSIWISGCFGGPKDKQDDLRSNPSTRLLILPQTLRLAQLSFTESYLTASNLNILFNACKDLKVFSFTNCDKPQRNEQQFSPIDLYSALACQQTSIQDLRVSLETDSISQTLDWDGCTYGSFKNCTGMRFLEVDGRFLGLAPAGLPISLEYLVIKNCQSSIFKLLKYLAALVLTGTELPSLRTVSVYDHILFPGGMLGLPLKGATEVLFNKAQQDLLALFLGTAVKLRFEKGLLEKTFLGYEVASRGGFSGDYGPFLYNQNPGSAPEMILK